MTGKELKAFAATVPDEAVIEVREKGHFSWSPLGSIRASSTQTYHCEDQTRLVGKEAE